MYVYISLFTCASAAAAAAASSAPSAAAEGASCTGSVGLTIAFGAGLASVEMGGTYI